jgi:hypothetical protein
VFFLLIPLTYFSFLLPCFFFIPAFVLFLSLLFFSFLFFPFAFLQIMRNTDPITGEVTAKLLDFGLSKNAGAGSSAKTFVGTPCYLGTIFLPYFCLFIVLSLFFIDFYFLMLDCFSDELI